jgi:hypothetical protein
MLSTELEYLCTEFEFFIEGWNAFYSVGMLSTQLEYLCTELECFIEGCNAF